MKLPLDHFRLIGVKPGATRLEIEQALSERLKNPPSGSYCLDTLDSRADILWASAIFLMDEQRCKSHERQLEANGDESGFPGIELESGQEMAAPLLLLEAKENSQAFALALEFLSRRNDGAAFHGHQQADLLLMAALAAQRTSQQMWTKRLYDQSAQVLERAIELMAQHDSQARCKAVLEDNLKKITPFRILDLLSQKSCTPMERQRGLSSLRALIDHRGGLDADDDEQRSPILFQDFFKQIRPHLTIDEQLELFESYSSQEGSTVTFLLAYTRAAAGFQRRQPTQINAALSAMEAVDAEGLEPEKACLLLLLGQPDEAQDVVESCQDHRLSQWLESYPPKSDSLPGLCSFCSQWLEQHVLPCYRDVDPHAKADLDAYFLDPEVQNYINDRDSPPVPHDGAPESKPSGKEKTRPAKDLDLFTPTKSAKDTPGSQQTREHEPLPASPANHWPDRSPPSVASGLAPSPRLSDEFFSGSVHNARGSKEEVDSAPAVPQRHRLLWPFAAKSALVVGAAIALAVLRPWSMLTTDRGTDSPTPQTPSPPPDAAISNNPLPALPSLANVPILFDRPQIQAIQEAERLDLLGVKILLRNWLDVKSAVLSTSSATQPKPEALDAMALLAVPEQVTDVLNQRQELRERGEQLQVRSTLDNISLLTSNPDQISARVVINYSETTRNTEGVTTNTFGPTILRNDYTFIRTQQGWKLLGFSPSPP